MGSTSQGQRRKPQVNAGIRARAKFFTKNAGGIVGENLKTALALAHAEKWLDEAEADGNARYQVEGEPDSDASWLEGRQRQDWERGDLVCLVATLELRCPRCHQFEPAASLGGIFVYLGQEDDYLRVVRAGLALEARQGMVR